MYCVTIYNENLRKLNGDESLRITRLFLIMKCQIRGLMTLDGFFVKTKQRYKIETE